MTRCPSQKPVEGSIEEGRFHEVSRITDAPWAHPLKRREPEFEESGGRLCGLRALRVRNKVRRRLARRARPTRCGTARNNQNKPRSVSEGIQLSGSDRQSNRLRPNVTPMDGES